MTIKEYNKFRSAVYAVGLEIPEVREAIDVAGIAYLYEVEELPDKHGVLVLTAKTQLNDNTLAASGFSPNADVRLRAVFNRQTKCVTF